MIEANINAIMNAPYSDPRAANSSAKEDGKGGSFGDALSTVKDDRPTHSSHAKPETDAKASERPQGETDDAAEKPNASSRRPASFLDVIANEQATEGKDTRLAVELQKAAKPDRASQENGKTGKRDKEKSENETTKAEAKSAHADVAVPEILVIPNANTAATRSPLDDIAQALTGKVDTARSQKTGKGDDAREKADPSLKDLSAALKVAGNDEQADTDNSGETGDFRFASSKSGAARSLDMSTVQRDARVDFDVKESSGKSAETVTVLDSRRFIGLAPSTNASALTGLIANDPEWVSAMQPGSSLSNAAAQSSTGQVVHTLKLHMTPIDLGSVTMSLRLSGDELAVHMTVDSMAAYKKLQDDSKSILDGLKAQGLTVDSISISIASSDKSDQTGTQSNNQQNQQTQHQGQQAADGRNRGESGARGGQQGDRDFSGGAQ